MGTGKSSNEKQSQSKGTHTIPLLYALIWVVALCLGILADILGPKFEDGRIFFLLFAVFVVFLMFMAESSVMFLELKKKFSSQNFVGGIFDVNCKIFAIVPLCFILGGLFYITATDWVFYLTVLSMGWLKYEIAAFANNIEMYLVDVKPTYASNTLKL